MTTIYVVILADDALGPYKDTPVSGSVCREFKAIYWSLAVLREIGFAELP